MNYQEALDFLYSQLPIFQRQGKTAFNKSLDKTKTLCAALGDPEKQLKFIHVAGTNGKGSVCHSLASVFKTAGYKTGLYTSPHLQDFRERIQINGVYIETDFVAEFVTQHQGLIGELKPSFFELTFALSLSYFSAEKTDIVLMETGMGGRLDSTNVIMPELSIITSIGLDHCDYLGDTLEKIALEKAGIIKPKTPVIIGNIDTALNSVFSEVARKNKAPIIFSNGEIQAIGHSPCLFTAGEDTLFKCNLPLKVDCQIENVLTSYLAFRELRQNWNLSQEDFVTGVEEMQQNFPLKGRWQTLQNKPKIIADVGHNEDGIQTILHQLTQENYSKLHLVFGMVNDKDVSILDLLPTDAEIHICQANVPRALAIDELEKAFDQKNRSVASKSATVSMAISKALVELDQSDLLLICGSLFVVAEALDYFDALPN